MMSTPPETAAAGAFGSWRDLPQRGRGVSLRTLIVLRWLSVFGQATAVLTLYLGLHFPLPIWPCLIVIALLAAMNVGAMSTIHRVDTRLPDNRRTMSQLGFDTVQLATLLALTGGLENPFCLLLVAPATIAAATLPARQAMIVAVLVLAATVMLYFWSFDLPWRPGEHLKLPPLYRFGMGLALVTGVIFTAGYAWRVASDAQKLELALATTSDVLQREQRLAALGGLAAAAAHELGTPLATIQVVAKELLRASPPDSPAAEDATLILAQAERCREILKRLSQRPEDGDILYADVSLKQLMEEVIDPHRGFDLEFDIRLYSAGGQPPPRVKRLPEVIHGLSALVENAADFATTKVTMEASVDAGWITIAVVDDGPGFSHEILPRLGEPYVTSRPHGKQRRALAAQLAAATRPPVLRGRRKAELEAAVSGAPGAAPVSLPSQGGMGLGFFIARTLLERTGARVTAGSGGGDGKTQPRGARVAARWARPALEVSQA